MILSVPLITGQMISLPNLSRTLELLARIEGCTFRHSPVLQLIPILVFGSITIDPGNHTARKNDEILKPLSNLLCWLCLRKILEGVLTHQAILKEIWGFGYIGQTQYLRVFVSSAEEKD